MSGAAAPPIDFLFAVHLHQPVGNFGHVFSQHLDDVYRPLLRALRERDFLPIAVHVSGPLLDWLETNAPAYLDEVGQLAADGRVELLLAGYYEPILASLPHRDRVEQIRWMQDAIKRRFGVTSTGLWLTERVWEPDLAADLADAGVSYVVVDDRHFLVTGIPRDRLHAPWRTEHSGRGVAVFPIDERLRYLIPFRPPAETVEYLRALRAAGHRLAVLADDGEKFGGWPGTKAWVYDRGWLTDFLDALEEVRATGEVRLTTPANALATVPSAGLAYLPTASYREMEGWSLPPDAALRLVRLEHELGTSRMESPDGALVRGGHWRNFLVKYPESNRMHKKMMALSHLCRERGDPPEARRAIGRAQCNDAYWHGVFGGLYLPFLRAAVWANLAAAEGELRRGDGLAAEVLDIDHDGHDEIWVHSAAFSAIVSPHRGGAIEELTAFAPGINYADALTRRREGYHETAVAGKTPDDAGDGDGTPSIHQIESAFRLDILPAADRETRALFQERLLPAAMDLEAWSEGSAPTIRTWASTPFVSSIDCSGDLVRVSLSAPGLRKRIEFTAGGIVSVGFEWETGRVPPGAWFTTELSHAGALQVTGSPTATIWTHPIETVAKSERGLDRTLQGTSTTLRWPGGAGRAGVRVEPVAP